MRNSGAALVGELGIKRGMKVMDLGCGDGTTALPAARLGANVLGVDIAKNLVEAGKRRAAEEGLANCRFHEGEASKLGCRAGNLQKGTRGAVRQPSRSADRDTTSIPATYLCVSVRVK